MTLLFQIEKRPQLYEILFIVVYILINNAINATSIIMEASRNGQALQLWRPFVLEYSSALSFIFLLPLIILLLNKVPLTWLLFKKNVFWHIVASVVFSLMHVSLMVLFRKIIYLSQGMQYQLGEMPKELFYEYRKDAWFYVFIVAALYCFRFVVSRLIGEAKLLSEGEGSSKVEYFDRLLVKKLGREFIIQVEDIEWFEACGNYVNLYVKGRIYPTRSTISKLVEQIADKGFCRIHRSHGVKIDAVESLTSLHSGDCELKLKCGKILNLSRRYKEEFKGKFG